MDAGHIPLLPTYFPAGRCSACEGSVLVTGPGDVGPCGAAQGCAHMPQMQSGQHWADAQELQYDEDSVLAMLVGEQHLDCNPDQEHCIHTFSE